MFKWYFTTKTIAPRQHRDPHSLSIHSCQLKQNADHTDTLAGSHILDQDGRAEPNNSDDHMIGRRTIGSCGKQDDKRKNERQTKTASIKWPSGYWWSEISKQVKFKYKANYIQKQTAIRVELENSLS